MGLVENVGGLVKAINSSWDDTLVSDISWEKEQELRLRLKTISPDDGKYYKDAYENYLTKEAEWLKCAEVQEALLETRVEFGGADKKHIEEFKKIKDKLDPLEMKLLEGELKHDQRAVIAEIGNHVSQETEKLLHPGTTSYDILDTARASLYRGFWEDVLKPQTKIMLGKLSDLGEEHMDLVQTGRTHLQKTTPVIFGGVMAGYAARLAGRIERLDDAFGNVCGKISGIVGTGASIEQVIGEGKDMEFEKKVLEKLGLEPDYTSTQIVQKEKFSDVCHYVVTKGKILEDFSDDMRILYSTAFGEVNSGGVRSGGSSADASKDNPINWENISGKAVVMESAMRIAYDLIRSNLQRDLRSSVQARYMRAVLAQSYEMTNRVSRNLGKIGVDKKKIEENLEKVRNFPSEAMTAITRAYGWTHPKKGLGYDAVKEYSQTAKREDRNLLEVALEDEEFTKFYKGLPETQKVILDGEIENYIGSARHRAEENIEYARGVINNI